MNKGQTLVYIQEMDLGEAKKTRVKSYFNRYFEKNPDTEIMLSEVDKIASMSRAQITTAKYQLE